MKGCGKPEGCGCWCGTSWYDRELGVGYIRYDVVCPVHDSGDSCEVCAALEKDRNRDT